MELYWYKAKVVKVIDGDTLDLDIDLGFDIWHSIRVRLFGVDTPETRSSNIEEKQAGTLAKEYVKKWLDTNGYDIMIQTFKAKTEKYGRILADVYDKGSSKCLNTELIAENLAKPYFGGKKS